MRLARYSIFATLLAAWIASAQSFEAVPFEFRHSASPTDKKHLLETMGGGVALVDVDGDGRLDLFFVNGADLTTAGMTKFPNKLYRNLGNWRFEDVTDQWALRGEGYGMGAAVGDFNNDGRPDIYVTAFGRNYLYRNTGSKFEEVADTAGVKGAGWSTGAAFLDFDRDGHPDLFVARYLDWDLKKSRWCGEGEGTPRGYCHPREFEAVSHALYRNLGNGKFEEVSVQTGIASAKGKGLGVKIEDVNADGWPDIFVANDSVPQQLFINRTGKKFDESAVRSGIGYDEDGNTFAGMGIDVADLDGDGAPDVFVNALARQGYWLYKNDGKGMYDPVTSFARMTEMHSGWGARFADFDNDSWRDLVVAQGHVMDTIEWSDPAVKYLEPPLLARNLFGKFFNVSAQAGPAFQEPRAGRGLAVGDLDGDGRLDIVISNTNSTATVLRNITASENHWLGVRLKGTKSNRDAGGAVVHVLLSDGKKLRAYSDTSGSYLSASSPVLHFGLAENKAETIEVTWPNGARTNHPAREPNRIVTITETQ